MVGRLALNQKIGVRFPAPQLMLLILFLKFATLRPMKYAFITLLIISFIGVAVFGFVSMIFGDTHNGGCIASSRLGALCPLNNVFNFIVFHIDAFKYFSTAIFVFNLTLLLVALSFIAFSVLPRPLNNEEDENFFSAMRTRVLPRTTRINKKINFSSWLSFHINSPAFILAAA